MTARTDWALVRKMMNAAIDFCETVEASGYVEADRDAEVVVGGQSITVHDILTSAWTYPEALRYAIIRNRHDADDNVAYTPETARILTAMAAAAAETIGAKADVATAETARMLSWFEEHAGPSLTAAIHARRPSSDV
jgi:hypothetical protein